jgi:hypothetical protein
MFGKLLLSEALVFPGLRDAGTEGFEELYFLAVHGHPVRS